MRELEGRSYEEIAVLTHCHLGTVKSRLNRRPSRLRGAYRAVPRLTSGGRLQFGMPAQTLDALLRSLPPRASSRRSTTCTAPRTS